MAARDETQRMSWAEIAAALDAGDATADTLAGEFRSKVTQRRRTTRETALEHRVLGWRSLEALSARLAQYGFERSRPRSRELQLDQSRKGAAPSAPVKSESLDGDTEEHGSFWRVVPERTRGAHEKRSTAA